MALRDPQMQLTHNDLPVFSVWLFEAALQTLIHQFKYEQHRRIGPWLGRALAEAALQVDEIRDAEVLVPVPLHRRRQADRGFNQSELLAQGMSSRMPGCRLCRPLRRVRYTQVQATLSREERLRNVKGAFALRPSGAEFVAGKMVVLVDDVFTTGSTLAECARVLLDAKPRKILAVTACRARD